jgi:MazG family protein
MTTPETPFSDLISLIQRLRGEKGCPWDRKQTAESMAPHVTEEAYELVDAVFAGSPRAVREELGDVLFQIFFIAHLYQESGAFSIEEVTAEIVAKMIRRHPHVFADGRARDDKAVKAQWDRIKTEEKKGGPGGSRLASVPVGLPALMRAYRISDRIARIGFARNDLRDPLEAVEGGLTALREALAGGKEQPASAALGETLLGLVQVAREAGIHPEPALSEAVRRLQQRFEAMEEAASAAGIDVESLPEAEKQRLWDEEDKGGDPPPAGG